MNVAIIFAGGVGIRMGAEVPKQFLEINKKPIIAYTLEAFSNHEEIDSIVLVCKKEWIHYTKSIIKKFSINKIESIVSGGETALQSQYYGLKEVKKNHPNERVIVLIHDGVRPLIDSKTISLNIESVKKYGNAITTAKAIETIIRTDDMQSVKEVYDRNTCRLARAPQSFNLNDILNVHEMAIKEKNHLFIDSASMMKHYGYKLFLVEGNADNLKITTPLDYKLLLGIIKENE